MDGQPLGSSSRRIFSTAQLIVRAQKGEESALGELLAMRAKLMLALAYGGGRSIQDAEDICQEVNLEAYERINDFKHFSADTADAQFTGWLKKILADKIADHCRKCKAQKRGSGQSPLSLEAAVNTPMESRIDAEASANQKDFVKALLELDFVCDVLKIALGQRDGVNQKQANNKFRTRHYPKFTEGSVNYKLAAEMLDVIESGKFEDESHILEQTKSVLSRMPEVKEKDANVRMSQFKTAFGQICQRVQNDANNVF